MKLNRIMLSALMGVSLLTGVAGCTMTWKDYEGRVETVNLRDGDYMGKTEIPVPTHLGDKKLASERLIDRSEGWDMFFCDGWYDKNNDGTPEDDEFVGRSDTMKRGEKPLVIVKIPSGLEKKIDWERTGMIFADPQGGQMSFTVNLSRFKINPMVIGSYAFVDYDHMTSGETMWHGSWFTDHSPGKYKLGFFPERDVARLYFKDFMITK